MNNKHNIEEKELIERALQNNRIAQKTIFDKYYVNMYTSAYRILNNENNALDAVQETFIKVFRYLHTFKFKSSLYTWIKKILIREAVKKQKGQIIFESEDIESVNPRIEWQDGLTGEYLHKAIFNLSEGYRTVFTLYEVEGYTHKEIAKMLNISEGTSKSQLYFAKKALQKELAELL